MPCCHGNCNQGRTCPNRKPASIIITASAMIVIVAIAAFTAIVGHMLGIF